MYFVQLKYRLQLAVLAVLAIVPSQGLRDLHAQAPSDLTGDVIPRDIREMYDRGLQYLANAQENSGDWKSGGEQGPGVTGLGVLAMLASGEDPDYGLYSNNIKRGLRNILSAQNGETGYFGNSMYHHGFAMLAIAEAYGVVDERELWVGATEARGKKMLGEALELGVRCAVTSQKKNSVGAWRYSPESNDADTSVSGAVLVGLLAARNTGIEVPDTAIDEAIKYYVSMTSNSGQVAYAGGLGGFDESMARISIATLVYSIAKRKDLPQFKSTLGYLRTNGDRNTGGGSWAEYTRYYQAQALFQGDIDAWEKWNKLLVKELKSAQNADGSFNGQFGPALSTSMSLLALALNYRFLPIYER